MMTLTPAYGRDYKSKKALLADWNTGKDFIINDVQSPWDNKPANKQDFKGCSLKFRYGNLRKICTIEVSK